MSVRISRVRVPSAGQSGGTERTNWALRDSILRLEEELNVTQAQLSRVMNELETLVALVKRAWNGDSVAGAQVAKIVGLALPDYEFKNSSGQMLVKITPKPYSINNWAKLVIGLLKKDATIRKIESSESQSQYFSQRQAYLAKQMTDNVLSRQLTSALHSRSNSYSDLSSQSQSTIHPPPKPQHKQTILSRQLSAGNVLYRPTSSKSTIDGIAPTKELIFSRFSTNSRSNGESHMGDTQEESRGVHRCDNPKQQYAVVGLLETDAPEVRQRLLSSIQRKGSIGLLATPNSAVYPRGERPLKYETTRPVPLSADVAKLKRRAALSKKPPSRRRPQEGQSNVIQDEGKDEGLAWNWDRKGTASPVVDGIDLEAEEFAVKVEDPEIMKVRRNIEKPESVVKFERDLQEMKMMEEDFRSKAVELQKRLGIDIKGMIC